MKRGGFLRALGFAAVAGIATVPAILLLSRSFGIHYPASLAVIWTALATSYIFVISPDLGRAVRLSLLTVVCSVLFYSVASSPATLAICLVALGAVLRSGFMYRGRASRMFAIEIMLAVGSVWLAQRLFHSGDGGALSIGLAVWGFFLIQSAFFVLGAGSANPASNEDAFDRAHRAASQLLDDYPDSALG